MKMKQTVKVGLLALLLGGAVALPVQEAEAATRCREVIRNGMVVKRTCTRAPDYYYSDYRDRGYRHWRPEHHYRGYWGRGYRDRGYRDQGYRYWDSDDYHQGHRGRGYRHWGYRTVCESYWRHGVKYRSCDRVW